MSEEPNVLGQPKNVHERDLGESELGGVESDSLSDISKKYL